MFTSVMDAQGNGVQELFLFDMARQKFDAVHTMSWLCRLWSLITFRSANILELKCAERMEQIKNRRYEGLRTVRIADIRGSENRSRDFDIHFHPISRRSRERWMGIATAVLQDKGLPPVELIKLNDIYFVRDGHHRISVAKAFGQEEIEAIVTSWESEPVKAVKPAKKKSSFFSLFSLTKNTRSPYCANGCNL